MKKLLVILSFFVVVGAVRAQDTSSYSRWKEQHRQQLQSFKDSVADDYKAFLEQSWREYELLKAEHRKGVGKPIDQPQVDSSDMQLPEEIKAQPMPVAAFNPEALGRVFQDTAFEVGYMAEVFKVQYYCREVTFRLSPAVSKLKLAGTSERQVAHFWGRLDDEDLRNVAQQLRSKQQDLYLNDWGLVDMVRKLSSRVYPENEDAQAALSVYLLNKMKYDVRIGKTNSHLVMLFASLQQIYERPYVMIDGKKYYALSKESAANKKSKITTYQRQYPEADHAVDLNIYYAPRIGGCLTRNPYRFVFNGDPKKIPVNKALVDFYENYPQTELFVYANAAVDEAMGLSIEDNLGPLTRGTSKVDAANLLLRYMQEGFKYMTDDVQFSREKTLFCEENFHYGANDCEDRSVLFSYLVRRLLDLDVVLLEYDGHVSTAVCFADEKVKGDYLKIGGLKYVVCDPTTKGARVGQQMRKYRRQTPKTIILKTNIN